MASLLNTFRKRRKMWFSILTLMCMLSFVFLTPLAYFNRAANRNGVVLTTNAYGSLNELDLHRLLNQRQIVLRFLTQIAEAVTAAAPKQSQSSQQSPGSQARQVRDELGATAGERGVVESWLLNRRALQLGLRMDDQAINDFIDRIREKRLSGAQVKSILIKMGVSQTQLFDALRNELLPLEFERMFRIGLGISPSGVVSLTPVQQWDGFLRLHRLASIEAIPVEVSPFLDQVPDPSEREIESFFNENKHRDYDPSLAEVGFHQPHRVDVQYFKIDHDTFFKLDAVTDQQIKADYEESKDRLYREEKKSEKTQPEAPKPAVSPKPVAPGKPAGAPKPEGAKPAEAPKASPSAPERKGVIPDGGQKPQTQPSPRPTKESGKSSSNSAGSPFSLVALEVKNAPAKKAEPASAVKGETVSKPQPSSKPQTPSDSPPQVETSQPQPPAAKTGPPPPKASPASTAAPTGPPTYIPLEKVKDEIRRRIATAHAEKEQRKVVDALKEELEKYHTLFLDYDQLSDEDKAGTPPPPRPSFVELAKQYGVSAHDTGLVSAAEAKDLEIAGSYLPGKSFLQAAFGPLSTFQPAVAADSLFYYQNGQRFGQLALYVQPTTVYLFWKTEDVKAATPDLKEPETRSLVVRQWKLQKARALAQEAAEKLATQARDAKKPLRDLFGGKEGRTVIEPPSFSWMSGGSVPGSRPELTRVPGIDHVGTEFMRSVFQFQPGQVGLAMNQPETIVYVVRLVAYSPTEETLWQQFSAAAADMTRYYGSLYYELLSAKLPDLQAALRAWSEDLDKQAGLRWIREPTESRASSDYGD